MRLRVNRGSAFDASLRNGCLSLGEVREHVGPRDGEEGADERSEPARSEQRWSPLVSAPTPAPTPLDGGPSRLQRSPAAPESRCRG